MAVKPLKRYLFMSENFAELFEESLKTIDMTPGSIVTGVVIDIDSDWVTVCLLYTSDAADD